MTAALLRSYSGSIVMQNENAIFERLEVTKKYGLVADYLVSWTGIRGRLAPKVIVWGNGLQPTDVVQHYIGQLLSGLVPASRIDVAAE